MIQKTVTEIKVPEKWESESDWDSHKGLLWLSVVKTKGKVCELGCGLGSTFLLDDICTSSHRLFRSYDTNFEWVKKTEGRSGYVKDYLEDEFIEFFIESGGKTLLFIDCAPGELRKELIEKYKDDAYVIVVHDSEEGADYVYGMQEILSTFKYRLDFQPQGKPSTTAVSNFTDVTNWV